ncbi:MAG: hypothetical protein AAB875_05090, partial [Patescibacteria group bacterium]
MREEVIEIASYLEKVKNLSRFKKKESASEITFSLSDRDASNYWYNISTLPSGDLFLNFQEKIIITGRSLADPKAAYLTTSAHTFTTKKRKLQKTFSDLVKAKKAIDKFFPGSAESGILVGKSDIAGREGMPALLPDGRILKVGGGEIIMSERASHDNCKKLSDMNVKAGGVSFDCDVQASANTDRASGKMPKDEWHQENAAGGTQIPARYKNMGFTDVGHMIESTQPEKKWMVLAKKGDQYKVVHGGQKGMEDFSQHKDEARRRRFWKRMGGEDSEYTRDPFSPLYWHKKYGTWAGGGQNAATGIQINKKTTKHEINNILTGKSSPRYGESIQDAISYL